MLTYRAGPSTQRGFTLIEAIVVMTLMAILAGLSAASFSWLNQTTRIRSAAFDLVADLDFARSEAIKRNADLVTRRIDVTPIGGSWNSGWTVTLTDAGVTTTLRQRGALGGQVAFITPAEPAALTYDGAGRLATLTTFRICPPAGGPQSGRAIRVDSSGLSRSTKTDCAAQ